MTDNSNIENTQQSSDRSVFIPDINIKHHNTMVWDWAHVCHSYCLCNVSLENIPGPKNISPRIGGHEKFEDSTVKLKYENGTIASFNEDGSISIQFSPAIENDTTDNITDIMDYDEYQLRGGRKTKQEYYASGGMKNVKRH